MLQPTRPASIAALVISVFAGVVAVLLWLMPKPLTRLEYMIAGAAGTSLCLLPLLLILTRGAPKAFPSLFRRAGRGKTRPRTVRKSERSS